MALGPTFSAVIATHRRPDLVLQAIRSVEEQTLPAHEIIVVVDGGADDTAARVRAAHPTAVVLEQSNLGPSVAHNTGVAHATCEWVCFLDDDDLWHRDKLRLTAEHLEAHPDCRAVRNPVWFFTNRADGPAGGFGFARDFVADSLEAAHAAADADEPDRDGYDYLLIDGQSFGRLLERNRGVLSSSVVHRQTLIRAGGFSPMQTCGDDWTMFVNVARLTEWHTIRRRLGFTRLHGGQNTADASNSVYILSGQINAWLAGRPLPGRSGLDESIRKLAGYGPIYRGAIQSYFWSALRNRQWRVAHTIRRQAGLLLPRFRDRLYVHLPPPLTWRAERYLLGMHR